MRDPRIAVRLVLPAFMLTSGCYYTSAGDWQTKTDNRPEATSTIAYGSELQVSGGPSEARSVAVALKEQPTCRTFERGTRYRVETKRESLSTWHLVGGIVAAVAGGTLMVVGATFKSSGRKKDQEASKALLIGSGGVLAAAGVGLIVPWALLPGSRTKKKEEPLGPYEAWKGAPAGCDAPRAYAARTKVRFEVVGEKGDTFARWDAQTDPEGTYHGAALARAERVAAWCGPVTLAVSDTSEAHVEDDTPASPKPSTGRHGSRAMLRVEPPSTRPPIAAIEQEDPRAAEAARACCADATARASADACAAQCAEGGAVAKCVNGSNACDAQARASEFPEEATAKCTELFSICLAGHGSSVDRLKACEKECAARGAERSCR